MSNKIWVIELSRGEWEDYVTWVHGVYDSEEKAIAEAERLDNLHYNSEDEYGALPSVYKDRWGNDYNVADMLFTGCEEEGDKFEGSSLFIEKPERADGIELVELPENGRGVRTNYRYVRKDFLEEFNVKVEEIPRLIDLAENSDRAFSPYPCTISVFDVNSSNYRTHPIYNGVDNPVLTKTE